MQADDRLGRIGSVEHTFRDHHDGATVLAGRRPFLGRLEDEFDGPGEPVAIIGEHLCRTHQHGHMRIVAAGMHDRHILAVVFAARSRGERRPGLFEHGQAIHVGAQGHDRAGFAADEGADNPGVGNARLHVVEAEGPHVFSDQRRGAEFAVR